MNRIMKGAQRSRMHQHVGRVGVAAQERNRGCPGRAVGTHHWETARGIQRRVWRRSRCQARQRIYLAIIPRRYGRGMQPHDRAATTQFFVHPGFQKSGLDRLI